MYDSDFEVDTSKVRQAARTIRSVAQEVQALAKNNVRAMQSSVESELVGDTANALQEQLSALKGDVERIATALNTIQKALITYAERLEEKDREIAAQMGSTGGR